MPIYEFFCDDCLKTFEVLCSMRTNVSSIPCEFCQGNHVKKKVSGFAIGGSNQNEGGSFPGSGGHSCGSCSSGSCGTCSH